MATRFQLLKKYIHCKRLQEMAYRLNTQHVTEMEMFVVAGANKAIGLAELVNTRLGFYQAGAINGELATFTIKSAGILVDADPAETYAAGDAVFDAGTPTGTVNKTSSAGRRLIGYVKKTYPATTASIELIDFDGTRAVIA